MEERRVGIGLPGAIIIAAAIIAIAIIYVSRPENKSAAETSSFDRTGQTVNIAPVTSTDHILGNPNAPIKMVEFSDPSCPYCQAFNPVMENIISRYGPTGKVAWIYRNFPLDKPDLNGNILHPNAGRESMAFECAAAVGGNDKFWAYEKEWFAKFPQDGGQRPASDDQKQITAVARDNGLDLVTFNDCLSSNRFQDKVEAEYTDGVSAGVSGTPTTFVLLGNDGNKNLANTISNALIQYKVPPDMLHLSGDGKVLVMGGALPEQLVTGLLSTILGN